MENINYEGIYQLTLNKQWNELLDFVYQYSRNVDITRDERLKIALKTFEDEFFRELEQKNEKDKNENFELLLTNLFKLDKGGNYPLSEERSEKILIELIEFYTRLGLLHKAYDFAKLKPKNKVCAEVIEFYKNSQNKILEHSQSNNIKVTINKNIADVNYTRSLFKSKQEIEFFKAVKEIYPMFTVYPNVALSCVIDLEIIKNALINLESLEENNYKGITNYFYKGIIDCVVFDHDNNYKPIYFFELDSLYHNEEKQQKNDRYKDKIFSLAGQKLFRIEKSINKNNPTNQNIEQFKQLIKDILNKQ